VGTSKLLAADFYNFGSKALKLSSGRRQRELFRKRMCCCLRAGVLYEGNLKWFYTSMCIRSTYPLVRNLRAFCSKHRLV